MPFNGFTYQFKFLSLLALRMQLNFACFSSEMQKYFGGEAFLFTLARHSLGVKGTSILSLLHLIGATP